MKKSIIAAGAASLALAAMPVVGAFATTQETFTDTLTVTVPGSCTFISSTDGTYTPRAFSATIQAGHTQELTAGGSNVNMSVKCNATTGTWKVYAIGGSSISGSDATGGVTTLTGTPPQEGDTPTIATGTNTTGDSSQWMFKIGGDVTATSPYGAWAAIPGSATEVASGTASTTGVAFTPAYQVYVSPTQPADTYTGHVSYLVVYPAS